MASGIAFSGLYSGIDWQSMTEQLIAVSHRKIDLITNRQSEYSSKLQIWDGIKARLGDLKNKSDSLRKTSAFNKFSFSSNTSTTDPIISGSASTEASPGNHSIKVSQLAQARKISSKEFTDDETALNISGEIVINSQAISIDISDSLLDIRDTINRANTGVNADIIAVNESDYRLILTSDDMGSDGFTIFDASTTDVLQNLGITDTNVSINKPISGGAESERYTSKTAVMKSLLGLTTGNSGTVSIGGTGVSIDLSNNTLEDIAAAIDAVPGVTATVQEETENEETYYYLKILGTTNFSDSNNMLETIGILKGGMNEVAEIKDGSITNTTDGSTPITASTAWADIYGANIALDDTISFSGADHDGNAVSGSLTITSTSATVQELLTSIESAFSSSVTASISGGKLRITDDTTGNSYLSLTLTENNEGGGFLDFGTVESSTRGREREIQTGLDSSFEIDDIPMLKSSNTVTDALPGVTLNLIKASLSTTVNFTISRNASSIKNDINSFINLYNENISYINSQFKWDDDNKQGGALMGDGTLFTVQSQLRETIFSEVTGLPSDYGSYLSEIGISSDKSGILSVNDSTLSSAISDDFDNVRKLFIGFGTASDSDIDFISYTPNSVSGQYDINITAAAEQASITGSTAINVGGITGNENLTITDTYTNRIANIALTSGDTLSTIISKINTTLQTKIAETITGSTANTTDGATPITATSTWSQIFGANVTANDTIAISGTNRYGSAVSGTLTIDDTSHEVQEILTKIENIFSSQVTASINASGKIVITDRVSGDSKISLTLTANNEGSGSLDFGTIDLTTEGRNEIEITAGNSGGKLQLTHNSYGSSFGYSIVSDVADLADGNSTGIGSTLLTENGVDVAGTINGEACTGMGQVLTGDEDEAHIDGLSIKINLTPAELIAQGSSQGTVNLTLGIADRMYTLQSKIIDTNEGYVSLHEDAIQDTIDDYQEQIDRMESRLEKERQMLLARFTAMEKALGLMKNQLSYLNGQIGTL